MSRNKNNNTKPHSIKKIRNRVFWRNPNTKRKSLDPASVVQKPKPKTQPNQGGGNQQSTEKTSSEGKSKKKRPKRL